MKSEVKEWKDASVNRRGGSLAVSLPSEYCEAVGIKDGDKVDMSRDAKGRLIITPAKKLEA